jgi:hypothetical protein
MSPAKPTVDAPRASARVLKEFVAVTYEFEQTNQSLKALRDFLDAGGEDAAVGVRILACILHAQVLAQKLVAMEIVARG